jgi:regulator of nucleoside diphosphate kinase
MQTSVICEHDRRDILALLESYRPYLSTEVEQIDILRRKIAEAIIVPADRLAPSIVTLYSLVRIVDLAPRREATYTLVCPCHASPARRRVSLLSPLGAAMLGCEQGTIIEIPVHTSSICFAITEVLQQRFMKGGNDDPDNR